MLKRNTQSGFGVVGIVIVIVVLGIIGGLGWVAYNNFVQKPAVESHPSVTSSTSQQSNTQVATPNPYSGWKTFCSSMTNACFKYDPHWTFAECAPMQVNMQEFQNCPSPESVAVVSADKTARISWYVDPYEANKNSCTSVSQTYSDITRVPGVDNLYFVNAKVNGSTNYDYVDSLSIVKSDNGQQPTPSQPGTPCISNDSFISEDGRYVISFGVKYAVNTNPGLQLSARIYPPSQATLNSIKQTLLSFYYK